MTETGMMMKPADLLAVAMRAIAVWLVVYTLSYVNAVTWVMKSDTTRPEPWLSASAVLGLGLPLAVAIAMWIWAYPAAAILLRSADGAAGVSVEAAELERVVLLGIGVYLLATRVASLTYWFVFFRRQAGNDPFAPQMNPDLLASICRSAVELLLGLWLVRGAPGLGRLRGERPRAGA